MRSDKETRTLSPSGKTSPEFYPAKTMPSANFWAGLLEQIPPSYQAPDGGARAWQLDHKAPPRGESWTLNISECPNDAVESSLSQVLQSSVAPKYYLSEKAIAGLVRRVKMQKISLPKALAASMRMAGIDTAGVAESDKEWPPRVSPTLLASGIHSSNHFLWSGCALLYPGDGGRPRRSTTVEHERLQGFPDEHTAVLSDTQRYKALGNSMAVPVIAWIGERLIRTL